VTAVVLMLAAVPLLWTPNVKVLPRVSGALTASMSGVLLFAADAWFQAGFVLVWQIALFVSLGESYSAFGGAMALAAVVGAGSGMLLGRLVDLGHGGRAAWIAFAAIALTTVLRAASVGDPGLAVVANACGGLVTCLYVPAFGTAVYNQARRSPCTLRFHIAAEAGWDLGGAAALLISAGLLALGVPIGVAILVSLIGTAAVLVQLRRYYGVLAPAD
jgi:MFS transporter, DHA1 family, inner membrane transport protein